MLLLTILSLLAAAFLFEDLTDQTSPYIHTVNDVSFSLLLPSALHHDHSEGKNTELIRDIFLQTFDTVMWDAVERHVKFSIGYLVETSYV